MLTGYKRAKLEPAHAVVHCVVSSNAQISVAYQANPLTVVRRDPLLAPRPILPKQNLERLPDLYRKLYNPVRHLLWPSYHGFNARLSFWLGF
jgi:hypothetical protein